MEEYLIVQLFINNYEIMDWNKLKKAIINATFTLSKLIIISTAYILCGYAILIACIIGVDYITLIHPVIVVFIIPVILFCLLVLMYYEIL